MATTGISISLKEGEETKLWFKAKKLFPEGTQDKEVVVEALRMLINQKTEEKNKRDLAQKESSGPST